LRISDSTVSSFVQPWSVATSGRYVAPWRLPLWVKEMRRPWRPSVQSRAWAQGVKDVRRVREQERWGSSEGETGGKRVSSKALDGGVFS
jgi:hypothetical protein